MNTKFFIKNHRGLVFILIAIILGLVILITSYGLFISADVEVENKIIANASASYIQNSKTYNIASGNSEVNILPNMNPPETEALFTFVSGFSSFGSTISFSSTRITSAGLHIYKFDGENNKWIISPQDGDFQIEPWRGYYVYNPLNTIELRLPFVPAANEGYKLSSGWNMLYSSSIKPRNDLMFELNNSQTLQSLDSLMSLEKIYNTVWILENERAGTSCEYFSLLETVDEPANCENDLKKKYQAVPAAKTFWVLVM